MQILEIAAQLSGCRCRVIRVTDEGLLPEIAQYGSYIPPLNVFAASKGSFNILSVICDQVSLYYHCDQILLHNTSCCTTHGNRVAQHIEIEIMLNCCL